MDKRQSKQDRRKASDRRSGIERRGSGAGPKSLPHAYAFRNFEARRFAQDRRLYDGNGAWDRRSGLSKDAGELAEPELGNEELSILFNRTPRC